MLVCVNCGWEGDYTELVCSDEDAESTKSVSEIRFDRCPDCGQTDFDEEDDDEEEEEDE